jgi:tetratricopeptide (TPR) repeat protein
MDAVTILGLVSSVGQLSEYAYMAYRGFNPGDEASDAWLALVRRAAEAAVEADDVGRLTEDRSLLVERLCALVGENGPRAWAILHGPDAVDAADLEGFDPQVRQLVGGFSANLRLQLRDAAVGDDASTRWLALAASVLSAGDLLAEVSDKLDDLGSRLTAPALGGRRRIPDVVERAFERARQIDDEGMARLERAIAAAPNMRIALRPLLDPDVPAWWIRVSGPTVRAAAELASAFGLAAEAAALYIEASEREGTSRARCLALAALTMGEADAARAADWIDRALRIDGSDVLGQAVGRVLANDPGGALESLGPDPHVGDESELVLAGIQRWALVNVDRLGDAVTLLTAVANANPDAAGIRLQLVGLLLQRADDRRSSREADLARATELALEARDARRQWGGDSTEATLVACEVALRSHAWKQIEGLCSEPPHGEANLVEAADRRVATLLGMGAAMSGDLEAAESAAARLLDPSFLRSLIAGWRAMHSGDQAAAQEHFRAAYETASSDEERSVAQRGVAIAGGANLPGLDELRSLDPLSAEVLEAVALMGASKHEAAAEVLARHRRDDAHAAFMLAEAYEGLEQMDAALDELRSGYRTFGDPSFLLQECLLLLRLQRDVEAEKRASDAMALVPAGSEQRRQLQMLLLRLALRRNDLSRAEDVARSARAEGDASPDLLWALALALHLQARNDEAWDALLEAGNPHSADDAALWLHVFFRATAASTSLERAVEVVAGFPDDERVNGTLLMLFYGRRGDREVSVQVGEHVQSLAKRFVERWPDSEYLWSVSVTPDDPEALLRQMEDLARPIGAQRAAIAKVIDLYDAGRAPLGLFARAAGLNYAEAVICRRWPVVVGGTLDASEVAEEEASAAAALGGVVVVDLSAAAAIVDERSGWDFLPELFRRIVLVDAVIADVDEAAAGLDLERGGSIGWDPVADRARISDANPTKDAEDLVRVRHFQHELGRFDHESVGPLSAFEEIHASARPWLGPVQHALDTGRPLFSDDLALRRLARSVGVPSFGRTALLAGEGAAQVGAMSERKGLQLPSLDDLRFALHDDVVVDILSAVHDVAAPGRAPIAAAVALGRPFAWATPSGPARLIAFARTGDELSRIAAVEFYALGACRFHLPLEARRLCATFVADLVSNLHAVAMGAGVVGLVRSICADRGVDDPFPVAVSSLCADLHGRTGDVEGAAQLVAAMFSGCAADDYQVVIGVLERWVNGTT